MSNPSPLIMVVEDDKFYASIYQTKLEREGYQVVVARDGQEALDKLQTLQPDLILLDLIMPIKDGYETLRDLRADDRTKDLKVIVFSNVGQDADIEQVKVYGVIDYLVKTNISIQEMVEKVKHQVPVAARPE